MTRLFYLSLLCLISVSLAAQAAGKGVEVRFLAERLPENLGKVVQKIARHRLFARGGEIVRRAAITELEAGLHSGGDAI